MSDLIPSICWASKLAKPLVVAHVKFDSDLYRKHEESPVHCEMGKQPTPKGPFITVK